MLQGLRETVVAGRSFPWPPVLGFCEELISRQGIAPGSSGEEEFTDSEVVGLLQSAFGRDQVPIPIELRASVWAILERLARSPEPSPEAPLVHPGASHLKTAPFNIMARVRVLELVFSYAIWIVREIMDRQPGITSHGAILEKIPEVRQTLEAYLDVHRHSAVEVRAFFGRILSTLAALDLPWVERNLSNIFPGDEDLRRLYEAAWRGYLLWSNPNRRVFRLLRNLYGEAVARIQPTAGRTEMTTRTRSLPGT